MGWIILSNPFIFIKEDDYKMKKRIPGLILEFILFVILLSTDILLLILIDNYIFKFIFVFYSLPILWDLGKFVFIEILDIILDIKYKLK